METTVNINDTTENDLNWKIDYDSERCTRCGRCIATCTFGALKMTVERRAYTVSEGNIPTPKRAFRTIPVVTQVATIKNHCVGCGFCEKVCPNDAIKPVVPLNAAVVPISAQNAPSIELRLAVFLR